MEEPETGVEVWLCIVYVHIECYVLTEYSLFINIVVSLSL